MKRLLILEDGSVYEGEGFGSAYATPLAGKILEHAIDMGY